MNKRILLSAASCIAVLGMSAAIPQPQKAQVESNLKLDSTFVKEGGEIKGAMPLMTRAEEGDESIYESPEGTTVLTSTQAEGYYYTWRGPAYAQSSGPGEYVICDNGDVYFKNPAVLVDTYAYLKGTIEGDKVVVKLPQAVGYLEDWDGNRTPVFMNMMEYRITDEENQTGWFFNITDPEQNVIAYDYDAATGTISMDLIGDDNSGTTMLGLVYDTESQETDAWSLYGLRREKMTTFDDVANTMPDGLATEDWALVYKMESGVYVPVGIDGDDLYLSLDFWTEEMGAPMVIKGKIDGNTVTFDDKQYLGILPGSGFIYLVNATVSYDETGYPEFEMMNAPLVCSYDPETNFVKAPEGTAWVVNGGKEYIYWMTAFYDFTLRSQTPAMQNSTPVTPVFAGYYPEIYYDDTYTSPAQIEVFVPNVSEEGYLLDSNNMYWEMYVDGEVYIFLPDLYTFMEEPMTQIPWEYDDIWDVWCNGAKRAITLHFSGYKSISFKSFNDAPNGQTYESGECVVLFENPDAVQEVEAQPVGEFFTNLSGVRVLNPESGLYIKTTVFSDGFMKNEKVMLRR